MNVKIIKPSEIKVSKSDLTVVEHAGLICIVVENNKIDSDYHRVILDTLIEKGMEEYYDY